MNKIVEHFLEAKLAEKCEQLEYFSKRDDEQEKQLEKQDTQSRVGKNYQEKKKNIK